MEEKKTSVEEELTNVLPDIKNIKSSESYTLPSKGLCYAEEENIPASITLRRMTTKEDKIRMRNEGEDQVRKDLLQACILENIDVGKLKLQDANFLLFKLRVLSLLDDKYKITCTCSTCGTQFIHEIELNKLSVNYLTKTKLKDLDITLPISKIKVSLKYPSLDNTIMMTNKLKEYFNRFPNADKGEAITTIGTMLYIDKVNGEKLLSEELEDFVDNTDILDGRYLNKAITKLDNHFGLNDKLVGVCPNCNSEVPHGLPITGELFTPST